MKNFLLGICLSVSLLLLSGCAADNSSAAATGSGSAVAAAQSAAPDFTYTDLSTGKQVKLSDLRGKPIFLNFWATWCPPCVSEMPHIQKQYEQLQDKMYFVAISLDDDAAAPKKFMQDKGYSFTAGYGDLNAIGQKYQIEAIPSSYLIDANGNIKAKMIGAMNESTLQEFLQK